jgi:diguanylate cyclase (GGDEF)-like protein/PAS domain S-box-containing protein
VYVNEAFEEMVGYSAEECLGRTFCILRGDRTAQAAVGEMRRLMEHREAGTVEMKCQRKDGSWFWNAVSLSPMHSDRGEVTHYIGVLRDVTRRRKLEKRAHHDWLTGLPNRAHFREAVRDAIRAYRDAGARSAVFFVDLDGFKEVNDSFGHPMGDQVLRRVGQRLVRMARENDVVARAGGDEFKILIRNIEDVDLDRVITDGLEDVFGPPLVIDGEQVHLQASVGVVDTSLLSARDVWRSEQPLQELARAADRALYKAKEATGTAYHRFSPESESLSDFRIQRENRLRLAIEDGHVCPAFQPIYRIGRGQQIATAFEVLCRWNDPDRGTVRPGEFISLAEQSGVIDQLTARLITSACRSLKDWGRPEEPMTPPRLFVNLSPVQLADPASLETIAELAEAYRPEWADVWFEVTESALLEHPERLQEVRRAGHGIVIDDFGTGYSSLQRLREMPVDALKIDMNFVQGIEENPADRAIVKAVCTLGRDLGITVVGEGVETPEQLEFLRKHGCRNIQGYLFARPGKDLSSFAGTGPARAPSG